ncbi:BON domain-containing protein [Lichenifustis flavocetrariae]|nr:BON domain-containing protein [Lichenifustis flavocetrariae]
MRLNQVSAGEDVLEPGVAGATRLEGALSFRIPFELLFDASAEDADLLRIDREKTGAGSAKSHRASCPGGDDADIAAAAAVRFAWHDVDPGYAVLMKVDKGWVTLSGRVDQTFKKVAAEMDVLRVPGVAGVTNTIVGPADVVARRCRDVIPHDAGRDVGQNFVRAGA